MHKVGQAIAWIWQILLFGIGATFVFGAWDAYENLALLTLWDLAALTYLGTGLVAAKISLYSQADDADADWLTRSALGARLRFGFGVMASLTGFTAAGVALFEDYRGAVGVLIDVTTVVSIIAAWLLLHVSYAGFYAALATHRSGPGLSFPAQEKPGRVDMLYFAFTIGTNLSVSDVTVTTRRMRWHVGVHSIVSFFYNAAVLTTAVKLVTG